MVFLWELFLDFIYNESAVDLVVKLTHQSIMIAEWFLEKNFMDGVLRLGMTQSPEDFKIEIEKYPKYIRIVDRLKNLAEIF